MKKEYIKPMMYAETFVPNQYAAGCYPGIDESNVEPFTQDCWWYTHASGCSEKDYSKTMFIENNTGCDLQLKKDGSLVLGSGMKLVNVNGAKDKKFDNYYKETGNRDEYPEAYAWPNGEGNWHYIPKSFFGNEQINGKPKYFVS